MPKRTIETSIEIAAAPATVWMVLTDFTAMPEWNPFIRQLSGTLAFGARLNVTIAPPGKSEMQFRPTIIALRPHEELRWLGKLFVSGIFDGEHYFLLARLADGSTRLTQGETFSGILVPLLGGSLRATETGFNAMNSSLKVRAEARATVDDATDAR